MMIFFSLFATIFVFWVGRTRTNILIDPFTVFFIAFLYYGYLIPVCMVSLDDYVLPFQYYSLVVSSSDINKLSILLFAGYAFFVCGYRLVLKRDVVDFCITAAGGLGGGGDASMRLLLRLSGVTFVVLIVFFREQLLAVFSGYEAKIETRYDSSAFGFFYNFFIVMMSAYFATMILLKRRFSGIAVAAVISLIVLAIVTFSKDPMVYAALLMLAIGTRVGPTRQPLTLLVAIALATFLLVFVLPTFSAYRSTGVLSFVSPADLPMAYLFSDASGPFSSIVLAVRGQVDLNLGPLLESFVLWVPRAIWEARPLDAAELYARAVMADWQPGYGLGFSPFAEAQIRYGLLLSPLLLFIAGLFMATVQRLAVTRLPPSVTPGLILVIQGYAMFTAHRGAFSGLVTAMAQFWIPFTVVLIIARYATARSSRVNQRTSSPL